MSDLDAWLAPKSDQLNADDLISGPRIIRVRKVKITKTGKQDGTIWFDGDNDKPWKPCKSMGRILRSAYGLPDRWIGKHVELWRDPAAIFGGKKVGGIRIKGLSDIEEDFETPVTISKSVRDVIKIRKIIVQDQAVATTRLDMDETTIFEAGTAAAALGTEAYKTWFGSLTAGEKKLNVQWHEDFKKKAAEVAE